MTTVPQATAKPTAGAIRDRRLPAAPHAIDVEGVTKTLGGRDVLDGVTFSVPEGKIFGLIGPSGCGKTTLVRLMVGLSVPDGGQVFVHGVEPARFSTRDRASIGYTPQGFVLYPTLTVAENANFIAGLYGLGWRHRRRRVRNVLEFLELWGDRHRLAREISGGMQRRLALAVALVHEPRTLFVDEPTAGLDPMLREKIWQHLQELRDEGRTVFVTTQVIDEAINCDSVAVLREGQLLAAGTPDELRHEAFGGDYLDIEADRFERSDIAALWQMPCIRRVNWKDYNSLRLLVDDVGEATAAVTRELATRGTELRAVRPYVPGFDEVFIELVNRR